MKRGIPFALQAAGVVLACLVMTTSFAQVDTITIDAADRKRDTIFIFDEAGDMIYCDTLATKTLYWVIKTSKTEEQLFYDVYKGDPVHYLTRNKLAKVSGISVRKAEKVKQLIINGKINRLVVKNVVLLPDKRLTKKIREMIADSGEGIDKQNDYREYGGFIMSTTKFTFKAGDPTDPRIDTLTWVNLGADSSGIGYYHSHPSGMIDAIGYRQGPSYGDQKSLKDGEREVRRMKTSVKKGKQVCYVFGMHPKSHLLYVLKAKGVKATIPFKYFESN